VGQGFHLKYTKSSQFFIDELKKVFPGLKVWSSEWNWVRFPRKRWDLAVFWQAPPEPLLLQSVAIDRLVLVPMWDTFDRRPEAWEHCRGGLFVCFSTALAEVLEGWGHRVVRVQYAPRIPADQADWSWGPQRLFFWPRKPDLTWATVEPLVRSAGWEGVHLHVTEHEDEFLQGLTDEDRRTFRVTQTRWFENPEAYRKALTACQVFLAPRRTEGIGMAFLEAMAAGLAVVAPDGATMNETIESGVDGWLYDPEQPHAPDWSQAERWGRAARAKMILVRQKWDEQIGPLVASFATAPELRAAGPRWSPEAEAQRRPVARRHFWFSLGNPARWVRNLLRGTR